MVWEVEVTDQFAEWFHELSTDQQESVTDRVDLLAERGPALADRWSTASTRRGITT